MANPKANEAMILARFNKQNLEMLEPYKDAHAPILARCRICNYERRVRPSNVSQGLRCPKCSRVLRLTDSAMAERLEAHGLKMLEPYINSRTEILTQCIACKYERRVIPNNIRKGSGCPKCSHRLPLTQSEVYARYAAQNLEMLEPFINSHKAILTRCCQCNHQWRTEPANVSMGTGCKRCAMKKVGEEKLFTQSEAADRFKAKGFEMLESYYNNATPIMIRCLKCDYERKARLANIWNEMGCPKCSKVLRVTKSEAQARFSAQGLEIIGQYKCGRTPVLSRCITCSYEYRPIPNNVFRGQGCPKCANRVPISQDEINKRFINRGFEILEPYISVKVKVRTRCGICKHEWRVRADRIGLGYSGCPKCAKYGFQIDQAALLYYLRVANPFGDPLYKIGITNRTVRERFRWDLSRITIIETWHFENGAEAYEMEQDILKDYDADRWTGPDILKDGNDELFNRDVLGLDKGAGQLELVA